MLDDTLYDVALCWILSHVVISTCRRGMGKSCFLENVDFEILSDFNTFSLPQNTEYFLYIIYTETPR
jgi:hypothetical protein